MGKDMINNRRSELEIINDILILAEQNVKKTAILYKCNLSYNQMQKYLKFLVHKKAIKQDIDDDGIKTYKTTRYGNSFLRDINITLDYFRV